MSYDKHHFTTYMRLLDAPANYASYEEMRRPFSASIRCKNRSAPRKRREAISIGQIGW